MTGPSIKRGKSKQDYETPDDFMAAVVHRFGPVHIDLAANGVNKKCDFWLGEAEDSLKVDWRELANDNNVRGQFTMWLNPPFDDIGPWAKKCSFFSWPPDRFCFYKVLLLTPASIGANWFRDHVHGRALVLALNGRLTFKGADAPYPKDCILSVFGAEPGFDVWTWKQEELPAA